MKHKPIDLMSGPLIYGYRIMPRSPKGNLVPLPDFLVRDWYRKYPCTDQVILGLMHSQEGPCVYVVPQSIDGSAMIKEMEAKRVEFSHISPEGRLFLPSYMIDELGITAKIHVGGLGSFLELCNPADLVKFVPDAAAFTMLYSSLLRSRSQGSQAPCR